MSNTNDALYHLTRILPPFASFLQLRTPRQPRASSLPRTASEHTTHFGMDQEVLQVKFRLPVPCKVDWRRYVNDWAFHIVLDLKYSIQWEETQDNLKLTMQRNLYGLHAPIRLMMERKIVGFVSDQPSFCPRTPVHSSCVWAVRIESTISSSSSV